MYLVSSHLKQHSQRSKMQVCLEAITWNQTKLPLLGFKIINHKEKHQVWIQSYIYMAFQPKTMDIEILFLVINIIANINN